MLQEGWQNGYCTSLENWRPKRTSRFESEALRFDPQAFAKRPFVFESGLPYEVRIEKNTRTIVITGFGSGTTAETLQLIADQRDTFREHSGFNLIYDSCALKIDSSPADMMQVAALLFEQNGSYFGRIAVVVPESREELGRIFAALAHPHGVTTNVFTNVSDARRWLGIERN